MVRDTNAHVWDKDDPNSPRYASDRHTVAAIIAAWYGRGEILDSDKGLAVRIVDHFIHHPAGQS